LIVAAALHYRQKPGGNEWFVPERKGEAQARNSKCVNCARMGYFFSVLV
jgi:hypothetical protein